MAAAFTKDPYSFLEFTTKTLSAAKIAIVSGANRGLVPNWNEKLWDVVGRADELTGFIEAQKEDPRRVHVKDPGSSNIEETSVFGGCYYLRDLVIKQDEGTCEAYLNPAVREFYVGMRAYKALCGNAEEAPVCVALAVFYQK